MKLLGRTLVILLAALVVVGAALGFAQTGYADALIPTMPDGAGSAPPGFDAGTAAAAGTIVTVEQRTPPTDGVRPEGRSAGGLFGAVDIAKDLGIIGLLVGLVALAPQRLNRRRGRTRRQPTRASPEPPIQA